MYDKSLKIFKAVAETGSFLKASGVLYISSPAVMKHIDKLEDRMKVKLFYRSSQGARLTKAGEVLYRETLKIIKFSDETIEKMQRMQNGSVKTITIGASLVYPINFFMKLWEKVGEDYPQYKIKVVPVREDSNKYRLTGSGCDCAFGPFDPAQKNEDVHFFELGRYRFVLAVPWNNPLSENDCLSFGQLCAQTLMIMKPGASLINDKIRADLIKCGGVVLKDIAPYYNAATFENCAASGNILLSLECWNTVHPQLKTVSLKEDYRMPYGIIASRGVKKELKEIFRKIQRAAQQK